MRRLYGLLLVFVGFWVWVYFRFDGSGGDNNYDAGSCVDGRLTSAWNWCSKARYIVMQYFERVA